MTKRAKSFPLPPGSLGLPIIGQSEKLRQNPQQFLQYLYQKHGNIFKIRFLNQNYIYMHGYEAVKFVLINKDNCFESTTFPNSSKIFGQTNIGMLTGQGHTNRRKLLAKALKNNDALSQYINTTQNLVQNYLEKWSNCRGIDLYSELNQFTLDLCLKLLLGIDSGSQTEIDDRLRVMFLGLVAIPISLPWTKFGRALESKKKLFAQLENIIFATRQKTNHDSSVSSILLTVKKETGERLTETELAEQIVNLLLLGGNSIRSALTSFLMLTIEHPDVLESIQTEQERLDRSKPISLAKLQKMVYLEQVIKEVLRQAPPVSAGFRKVTQDCYFQGYRFPQGWNVIYSISSVLQDPEIYQQPEKFNPARFASLKAEDKGNPFCFIPFGGGARECMGKELTYLVIKIFISVLQNNYDWKFKPNQDLTINQFPGSHPNSKVEAYFSKR